jgi:hypothetical protein
VRWRSLPETLAAVKGIAAPIGVAAVAVALVAGGCGEDGGTESEKPPRETADPLPKLPRDWKPHVNRSAGFAIGVPSGWSARNRGRDSLFRSGDRLVAVSVSADRGAGALALPIDEFAERVAEALPRLKRLRAQRARPFDARYQAVAVPATGRAAGEGVPQRLLVVVQRREGLATYTVLVARNAKPGARAHRDEIRRMLRSLRGRPPR